MYSISQENFELLDRQLQEIKEKMAEGKSTREVLAAIYQEQLPEKSDKQAKLMADEVIDSVTGFYQDLYAARENREVFIEEKLSQLTGGQDLVQRCNTLLRLQQALASINMEAVRSAMKGEEQTGLPSAPEVRTVTEEEATSELEAELATQVKALLDGSLFLAPLLPETTEFLSQLADGDTEMLLDAGSGRLDYLATISMLAYINIKSGVFPEIPEETTLHEVATMVCAAYESNKAAAQAAEEGWVETALAAVLELIGLVAAIRMAGGIIAIGLGIILLTPVTVVGMVCTAFLTYCGVRAVVKGYQWWAKDTETAAAGVVKSGRVVVSGLRTLFGFVKDRLLPACAEKVRGALNGLLGRFAASETDAAAQEEEDIYEDGFEKQHRTVPQS